MHILFFQFIMLSLLGGLMAMFWLSPKKRDVIFMVLAFVPMWYIHSMVVPDSVPDLTGYELMFDKVRSLTWIECLLFVGSMEPGFVTLNKMVSLFTSEFLILQGIIGFVMLALYFHSFRKYSPCFILSVILLLATSYNISIYVLRQYLAVAIFITSFPLIFERKLLPYLLICVLNFFIHKTAIVCIPVYFIYQMKPWLMVSSITILALTVFFAADFIFLLSVDSDSFGNYEQFLGSSNGGQNWVAAGLSGVELAIYVFFTWKKILIDNMYKLVFVLLALFFLVNVAIMGNSGTLSRLPSYYGTASLFALPLIINNVKEVYVKVGVSLFILFFKVFPTFLGTSGLKDVANMQLISIF